MPTPGSTNKQIKGYDFQLHIALISYDNILIYY